MQQNTHHIKKRLGQNFLINTGIVEKIGASGNLDDNTCVLEIGAGKGILTEQLLKYAKKIVAVEIDRELVEILNKTFIDNSKVVILHADILKVDLCELVAEHFKDQKIVVYGNLPYYITSSIVMKLLESRIPFQSIVVMVQKETAIRFTAPEGSRDAGAVTMAIHYYSKPHFLFEVSSGSFYPRPKVQSAVIRLDILETPSVSPKDEALLLRLIKVAFMQRRKTAVNAISAGLPMSKEKIIETFNQCKIDLLSRTEQLTLADFTLIADEISNS